MKFIFKTPKKIFYKFFALLSNLPMPGHWRWKVVRYAGVRFKLRKETTNFFYIGDNVVFDSAYPEDIEIGSGTHITTGCVLLNHYLDTSVPGVVWKHGKIIIEEDVFLGAGTIVTKPCKIGKGSIIGAGSVVTKDIPPYEIWCGTPARFVRKVTR